MSLLDFLIPDKTIASSVEDIPIIFAAFQVFIASTELFCTGGGCSAQVLGFELTLTFFFGLPRGLLELDTTVLGVSTSGAKPFPL